MIQRAAHLDWPTRLLLAGLAFGCGTPQPQPSRDNVAVPRPEELKDPSPIAPASLPASAKAATDVPEPSWLRESSAGSGSASSRETRDCGGRWQWSWQWSRGETRTRPSRRPRAGGSSCAAWADSSYSPSPPRMKKTKLHSSACGLVSIL